MKAWINDSRRPALSPEEGALLPALARRTEMGGAALRTALGAAREIGSKRLGAPVSLGDEKEKAGRFAPPEPAGINRAALHQVLRNGRRRTGSIR